MPFSALVVGASGIVGNSIASHLLQRGWQVHGLARRPPTDIEGLMPVAADLLDPASLRSALRGQHPENVFITTWLRQNTETENIRINRAMVRNLLDVLSLSGSVKHVALVTGLKHYLGPFEAYGKGLLPRRHFAKSSRGSISRISTMPRRTSYSRRQRVTASAGACIDRTRSLAMPLATP